MGKSCGNYSNSYHANRSSGCPYNGNRSGSCPSNSRQRAGEPCRANEQTNRCANHSAKAERAARYSSSCESESRSRGCEGENLNRMAPCRSQSEYACQPAAACRASEYSCAPADAHCENEAARRASEYSAPAYDGGAADACCENEYACSASDAACGYVWRGMEQENRGQSCGDEYESCPAELHVHEAQGSVQAAGERCAPHTHRFACISCEPILLRDGRHAHMLTFRTDSCEGHCHEFSGMTTAEYEICDCHVHYIEGETTRQAGHCHPFRCVTQIENPMED